MKGVVFDGSSVTVTDDLAIRPIEATEVAVAIKAAGLCHSDLSVINGTIPYPTPVVLGHEGAGIVTEVGSAVTNVAVGDHVALSTLGNCGACRECDSGRPTMCRKTFGFRPTPFTYQGAPAYSFANVSVFAERAVVKGNQAVKIPSDVPFTSACLIGCGVLTGVGAALNRAKVAAGETVAVIGVGGIGLNVIQGARAAGASRILALDLNPAKESLARQFGATDFLNTRGVDLVAAVKELLPAGVDVSVECVGHPGLLRNAIDMLDWAGRCVALGVPEASAEGAFNIASLYLDKSIMGCRYGSSRPQTDIPLYVDMYRQGRLMLDELVSRTYPLEDISTAIHDLEHGDLARAVLTL